MSTILFAPAKGIPGRATNRGNMPNRIESGKVSTTNGPTYYGQAVYWDASNELTVVASGNNFAGIAVLADPTMTGTTPFSSVATAEAALGAARAITAGDIIGVLTNGHVTMNLATGQTTPRHNATVYVGNTTGVIESISSGTNTANAKLRFVDGAAGSQATVAVNI